MAGVTPNEGEDHILSKVYINGDYEIGLFTNSSGLDENSVWADIIEPSGSYTRQTLNNWTISNGNAAHPTITFSATVTDFVSPIYGYFIKRVGVDTLVHFEVYNAAPVTIAVGDSYLVDLSNILD